MALGQDHAVVEILGVREPDEIPVFQRGHLVQVEAAAQVGDLVAGHQAEQPVEAVVAGNAQRAVALDAAAFHEAGPQAAVIVSVLAGGDQRCQVPGVALVVTVQHHQVIVLVGDGILERHLVAAAETVVLVVAQQPDRLGGVLCHPGKHRGLGAVGGAVVHHNAARHKARNLGVQQLVQHPGHLFFTVVGGNKQQDTIRHNTTLPAAAHGIDSGRGPR